MPSQIDFSDLLQFFRTKPPELPGDLEYNATFCKILITASSAEEASIWQLDNRNQLHPIYGTNFTSEDAKDVYLREGEEIWKKEDKGTFPFDRFLLWSIRKIDFAERSDPPHIVSLPFMITQGL
jgi:hypothetical protein